MKTALSLDITPSAADRIKSMVKDDLSALKISIDGGGCQGFSYSLSIAAPEPDDVILYKDGARIAVDAISATFLEGATLDWVSDLMGDSFRFHNPNATSSCGCGTSFSV